MHNESGVPGFPTPSKAASAAPSINPTQFPRDLEMWAGLRAAAPGATSAERLSIFTTVTPLSPSNCRMTLLRRRRKLGLAARLVRWSRVVVAAAAELLLPLY